MNTIETQYVKLIQSEIRSLSRFKENAMNRSTTGDTREVEERFDKKIECLKRELELGTPRYEMFMKEQQEMIRLQKKNTAEKQLVIEYNNENRQKLDEFHKEENRQRRKERSMQYHMKRDWEWLCSQDTQLPPYIRENLTKMPNNKGYIWRGIWYFGQNPDEDPNTLVMFERAGPDMFIHEIRYGVYKKIYQKPKNGVKTLVSETYF